MALSNLDLWLHYARRAWLSDEGQSRSINESAFCYKLKLMGFYWVMLEWRAETMKYFCMKIDLCHGTADLLKFEHANTCIKHTIGKNKPCLVSTPIFRVRHVQSTYHELPLFWKLYFYKVLYGERARLAHSTICHMITIFKLMALWLWQLLVHLLILVCSFHLCVLLLCLAKLYRSCPICDKGL